LALNITGADSLFIQHQPHINKQAGEHDGQRLSRSGHAGPAAVFSFSQQALDSAKDVGRSQFGIRSQVAAPTATFRAALDYGAQPVETAAALPPTAEAAEARAAKADPPRREYWDASRLSTKSSSSSQTTSSPKNASNLEESATAAPAEETRAAEDSAAAEETWAAEDTGSTEETWGTEEAVSTEEPESAEQADQQVSYQDLLDNVPMSFEDYFS
jgi:hypothetical protein